MPTPIVSIHEYVILMRGILQRELSPTELEHIQPCACGQEYCRGWKTQLDLVTPNRLEV